MNLQIRPETPDDYESIKHVNQLAFPGSLEAKLVDELRNGGHAIVSVVAVLDEVIVGHILFSPVSVEMNDGKTEVLSLAPMAVLPEYQRIGIGTALVEAGINECRKTTYTVVVVLGHPAFYPRFGFRSDLARSLSSPFGDGEAWMAMELVPKALHGISGTVVYPPPFREFD